MLWLSFINMVSSESDISIWDRAESRSYMKSPSHSAPGFPSPLPYQPLHSKGQPRPGSCH